MWYWHRDNHINQWDRIENPEIDPHNYAQQIFDKGARTVQWEKGRVFNKWCWSDWISTGKKMNINLTSNLMLILTQNNHWHICETKTIKLVRKCIQANL